MSLGELKIMANEIENEIELCNKDLKKVGSLVIKTQSLMNLLAKEDPSDKEVKVLKIKASSFQSKARELSERRSKEKQELENELMDSKIRTKKITEMSDFGSEMGQSGFFAAQSSKLDDFISTSMDSLESLRRQSVYIDRINETLRRGAFRLGVSNETLSRIESRFAGDKSLFIILLIGIVALVLILRFIL
ncbi:uncharacterized protein VICG_00109 [Vittaforma corneae ATCC 50505]|uniref:Uncharacterized protein n=1 Tax=Vittaforma corneae (strain ATCC 50505) TaxID=993615 RepID=L2GQA2_VITCO|nr:uncharacterized protein VICG_00109 [Vittaforma corneae ATCC 50505]ELA42794.1 hypothetical protein VICG_00109 [Vittaforma corneae ATCC 50505]